MSRRKRREIKETELEITAFMNLMVILVPFLLVTAVFSRITVIDLFLPTASEAAESASVPFNLEVVVRANVIEVRESKSQFYKQFAKKKNGHEFVEFGKTVMALKTRYPQETDATLLAEPGIDYDTIIQVMDRLRMHTAVVNKKNVKQELFSNISIGDAPNKAVAS